VAGTPGTSPTNWAISVTNSAELSTQVVAIGIESGISYIDVKLSGTVTAARSMDIAFESLANFIAASSGQTWNQSVYLKQVAGSQANISGIYLQANTYTSGGAYVTTPWFTLQTVTTDSLITQRKTAGATLSGATTAFIAPFLNIPTTTTALTRNADVASMTGTNFSSWYNASEGTFVTQFTNRNPLINAVPVTANDNTNNNRIGFDVTSTGFGRLVVDTAGASQVLVGTAGLVAGGSAKMAGAYKVNDFAISKDGGAVSTDTNGTVPTVTQLQIGSRVSALFLNSYIQRIAYYPTRLPDATLVALTA